MKQSTGRNRSRCVKSTGRRRSRDKTNVQIEEEAVESKVQVASKGDE